MVAVWCLLLDLGLCLSGSLTSTGERAASVGGSNSSGEGQATGSGPKTFTPSTSGSRSTSGSLGLTSSTTNSQLASSSRSPCSDSAKSMFQDRSWGIKLFERQIHGRRLSSSADAVAGAVGAAGAPPSLSALAAAVRGGVGGRFSCNVESLAAAVRGGGAFRTENAAAGVPSAPESSIAVRARAPQPVPRPSRVLVGRDGRLPSLADQRHSADAVRLRAAAPVAVAGEAGALRPSHWTTKNSTGDDDVTWLGNSPQSTSHNAIHRWRNSVDSTLNLILSVTADP